MLSHRHSSLPSHLTPHVSEHEHHVQPLEDLIVRPHYRCLAYRTDYHSVAAMLPMQLLHLMQGISHPTRHVTFMLDMPITTHRVQTS